MALTYVEVRDHVLTADESPAQGRTVYTPSGPVTNGTTAQSAAPIYGDYNATGISTVRLAAADDPGTAPSGLTYTAIRHLRGLDGSWLAPVVVGSIQVLAADVSAGIDLPDRETVEVLPEMVQYALSVAGVAPNPATGDVPLTAGNVGALPVAGGEVTGVLTVDRSTAPGGYPIGQAGSVESLSILSSPAGGEDDGTGTDTTGRLNLYSYQRASTGSFGETIRHFAMRKDSKQMEAWYFPSGGYDAGRNPVGSFKPVVWAGAHWEANNHASNHKHWSVETPSSTGSIETRFEVRFGNPTVENAIAGLDKTMIATNLADFVVRCTNGQEMRLTSPNGQEKKLVFSRDAEGAPEWRRWAIRSTDETEAGANAGSNFQVARYDDTGTFQDNPIVVSRSTGNVTLGPGFIARRGSASASSLSLNSTSLGGGVGVIAVGNAPTPPASNPTGGGVLYAEAGALKWRGSSGTVTTLALA